MHKMGDQTLGLAVHVLFTRMVKMKLLQSVDSFTDLERAPGSIIDLYGMSIDRKSTRLNSSHVAISYAVFCLKKKILPMLDGWLRPAAVYMASSALLCVW